MGGTSRRHTSCGRHGRYMGRGTKFCVLCNDGRVCRILQIFFCGGIHIGWRVDKIPGIQSTGQDLVNDTCRKIGASHTGMTTVAAVELIKLRGCIVGRIGVTSLPLGVINVLKGESHGCHEGPWAGRHITAITPFQPMIHGGEIAIQDRIHGVDISTTPRHEKYNLFGGSLYGPV